ncbi:MAG: DNA methyltransferase [Bacteroidota bacterium]
MEYKTFLESKRKTFLESGFSIDESELNTMLKDFQKFAVKIALFKGKFALFFDCGLGKTFCQLEWAKQVKEKTNKPVLLLAPLAICEQTINEGVKFGIQIDAFAIENDGNEINNYDQLKNIDVSKYSGIVLDESSILKGKDGKLSQLIIETFKNTPYKLCCTATPSPNDHMELGQHSEFLGAMSYLEMLAMFFVHDGGETSKWRLRKHAADPFWKYVSSWSMAIDNPATLGFDGDGYYLPEIEYIEHVISVENKTDNLFGSVAVSATDLHKDLKRSFDSRIQKTVELVNSNNNQWIVWGLKNDETDTLSKLLPDSINVQGSNTPEYKAKHLNGFAKKEFKTLITKTSIASFGMNYQQCNQIIFTSYDFKFEAFYQAVRRCYRFGQKNKVIVHILIPESQINVRQTILSKEKQHFERISEMSKYSAETNYKKSKSKIMIKNKEIKTDYYHLINGDAVTESKKLPTNCADISVFSPPFAELYVYSDKEEDMGNVSDYKQFEQHFRFLIPEIKRVLKPGRICAIHCMDLPIQKGKEGYIGLRDFSGMLIDWFQKEGFIYHSKVTIWKNPVTEMQRTKALGLLHKTIKKDSVMSRVGIPDYVLFFRNSGENAIPISHQDTNEDKLNYLPVELWQKYASPVWYDIDYSRTLQYRSGRDGNDEKHICPLQLDTIERVLHLYSNEGETVFSPFGGIGSEGFAALKMNRKSISIELKESYFNINAKNHKACIEEKESVLTLF